MVAKGGQVYRRMARSFSNMVVGSRGHKEMAKKEFHINNKAWYEMHGVSKLIILKEKIGFWKKKKRINS